MNPDPSIPLREPGLSKGLEQLSKKLWIRDIKEDDDYMYIKMVYGLTDSLKLGIFNKHDNNITFLNGNGFTNDLDGGVNFWPRYIYKDSVLVDYVNAYDFKAAVSDKISRDMEDKYGKKYAKLIQIAGELKDESNPVLIAVNR